MSSIQRFLRALIKDRLLLALAVLALLLAWYRTPSPSELIQAVDWPTIAILSALLVLTRGFMISGVTTAWGKSMLHRLSHVRQLAVGLVAASIVLSMLLTNDVALFVVVPFTIGLSRLARLPTAELVVFEALAVNAGSLMSPIGNPQNILLWQQSGLSFVDFFLQMLPLGLMTCALLFCLVWWRLRPDPIVFEPTEGVTAVYPRLAWLSLVLLALFVVAVEYKLALPGLLLVIAWMGWRDWQLVVRAGWSLIVVFVLMFVNIYMVSQLAWVESCLIWLSNGAGWLHLLSGALLSQLISNVPATMLMLETVPASKDLAYGVNVGGFGLAIGSLASLIALRMYGQPGVWRLFHCYAIPFLLVSLLIASSLV